MKTDQPDHIETTLKEYEKTIYKCAWDLYFKYKNNQQNKCDFEDFLSEANIAFIKRIYNKYNPDHKPYSSFKSFVGNYLSFEVNHRIKKYCLIKIKNIEKLDEDLTSGSYIPDEKVACLINLCCDIMNVTIEEERLINLSYMENVSQKEIAKLLGRSESWVSQKLISSRRQLMECIVANLRKGEC